MSGARPRRRGGLGCLGGLVVLLVGGTLFVVAVDWVFAPWIYGVGGQHRLLPVWAGQGDATGPGGRYRVWVWFSPTPQRSRMLPGAAIQGSGYICTPRGQLYQLRVIGGASGRIWNDMNGHSFHIEAYHRPILLNFSSYDTWRPRLSFSGRWVGPDLVMSDDASLAHAFAPDGSLNDAARGAWHPKTGAMPITLKETGWQVFAPKCEVAGSGG
jgi:hypothetical protein